MSRELSRSHHVTGKPKEGRAGIFKMFTFPGSLEIIKNITQLGGRGGRGGQTAGMDLYKQSSYWTDSHCSVVEILIINVEEIYD